MQDDSDQEMAEPGWKEPSRPAPQPRHQARPSEEQLGSPAPAEGEPTPAPAPRASLRDRLRSNIRQVPRVSPEQFAEGLRYTARSIRGSTDDEESPRPVATSEGLEELGETLLIGLSKVLNWIMAKRRSRVDWRMTEGEAASIAAPATRMLARRMQIRADLSDATDVGRGADGVLSYVFRILSGESPDDLTAEWAARQDYERARVSQPVQLGQEPAGPRHVRAEPEASSFEEVGRDEAERVPAGVAPTVGPTRSYFVGFEDA